MYKILNYLIISGSILILSFSELFAGDWQQMMDSTLTYQEKQELETALKWSYLALPLAENQFGKLDTNYLFNVAKIAELYYYLGKPDSMVYYSEIHLSLCREMYKSDHPALASSLGNLAYFYNIKGNYKASKPLFIESLEMYRRLYDGDNPDLANSINNMAYYYDTQGNYDESEKLYLESLSMYRRLFKEDQPFLANCINNLAAFYNDRANYTAAEPLFKEALAMYRRLYKGDHPDLANSINNLAAFYSLRGNFSAAEPLYKEGLEMFKRLFKGDYPALAQIINNIAYFYNERGMYDAAEPLYIEALEMRRRLFKSDHPDLANSINNLATFYNRCGKFSEAESLFKESLDMFRRIFHDDHPNLANIINNVAFFYDSRNKYSDAEPLYLESLAMRRRMFKKDHPDLAQNINNLAHHYIRQNKYKEAEPLIIEALEIYTNVINSYFPSLSESEKSLFWLKYKDNFDGFNTFAIKRMKENPYIIGKMFDNQLFTKAILYNSTNKIKKRIQNSKDSSLISDYNDFVAKREQLVNLYTLTKNDQRKRNINIDSLEELTNNIEKKISLRSEIYKQSYESKRINWHTVQMALKPDEVVIEMVRFQLYSKDRFTDTIYYAVLIVSDQTTDYPDIILLENGKVLEENYFNAYRKSIKARIPDKESFKAFWGKIYDKTKQYKKIYFAPDGIFNKINISTFEMPDGKYLLDRQEIQHLNSSKDLLTSFYQRNDESSIYNNAVLVGNPSFDSLKQNSIDENENSDRQVQFDKAEKLRSIKLNPLPGTEKEVQNIEEFLKSKKWVVNTYTKNDAVKSIVKNAKSPRVLHIATHGFFLPNNESNQEKKQNSNPLFQTGLFFAGASVRPSESNSDAGILTAYEAMNLELDKTELVVLSACETGLGEIKNGEGVFGLRRAFQQAGAKSVLMSLWSVNDDATQELMTNFYQEWLSGKSKREAFNIAQQQVRSKYAEPYFWGAFVMVGE